MVRQKIAQLTKSVRSGVAWGVALSGFSLDKALDALFLRAIARVWVTPLGEIPIVSPAPPPSWQPRASSWQETCKRTEARRLELLGIDAPGFSVHSEDR